MTESITYQTELDRNEREHRLVKDDKEKVGLGRIFNMVLTGRPP